MRNAVAVALLLSCTTWARAETMEVRPSQPVAEFDLPDDWKVTRIARGVQAISKDGEVDFWIEAYKPDEFKQILDEHNAYWKDQGVVVTGSDAEKHAEGGKEVTVTTEHATWKGEPTVLYYVEYNLGLASQSNIVVSYWASPDGDKTYQKEVGDVLGSLKLTEK